MKAPPRSSAADEAIPFASADEGKPPGFGQDLPDGPTGAELCAAFAPSRDDVLAFLDEIGATAGDWEPWDGEPDQWWNSTWAAPPARLSGWLGAAIKLLNSEFSKQLVHDEKGAVRRCLERLCPLGLETLLVDPPARAIRRYSPLVTQIADPSSIIGQPRYISDRAYNPIIALSSPSTNEFMRFMFGDEQGGGVRSLGPWFAGLAPHGTLPTSYALPLNWVTATRLDIDVPVERRVMTLPNDVQSALVDYSVALRGFAAECLAFKGDRTHLLEAFIEFKGVAAYCTPVLGGLPAASITVMFTPAMMAMAGGLTAEIVNLYGHDLYSFADALSDVAVAEYSYAEAIERLLQECITIIDSASKHWAISDEMQEDMQEADQKAVLGKRMASSTRAYRLAYTFHEDAKYDEGRYDASATGSGLFEGQKAPRYVPILHLSDQVFRRELLIFRDYAAQERDFDEATDRKDFLIACHPMIQFANAAEIAATLLVLGAAAEGTWYALGPAFASQAGLGHYLRNTPPPRNPTAAYEAWERACPGVSFGLVLRFLWRQALVDRFLDFIDERALPCAYEVFCWMATEGDRFVIDAVLGPARRIAVNGGAERIGGIFQFLFDDEGVDGLEASWATLGDRVLAAHAAAATATAMGELSAFAPMDLRGEDPREIWWRFVEMVKAQRDIDAGTDCFRSNLTAWMHPG